MNDLWTAINHHWWNTSINQHVADRHDFLDTPEKKHSWGTLCKEILVEEGKYESP